MNLSYFLLFDPDAEWSDRFWAQMARLAPESYIAEGTVFTFASRNTILFTKVLSSLPAIKR